jgi:ornithine racemase
MIKGGVSSVADSRVENLKNLKNAGIQKKLMLLRTPMISEIKDVVEYADISLQSELKVIQKLSEESINHGEKHKIILMVEMGDLREGMNPSELDEKIEQIQSLQGIKIQGIGMNLACFGGVAPTNEKIKEFNKIITETEEKHNIKFEIVSGGNSANIPSLIEKIDQGRINNLRIGEGILLGLETVNRSAIPGCFQDTFFVEAEIIELKKKRSKPYGMVTQNAFGETPEFKDRGEIIRGIVALGKQDVIVEDLKPYDENIDILGSSSDHIIVEIKNNNYNIGDKIKFGMKYGALVHLCTSKYVKKKYINM